MSAFTQLNEQCGFNVYEETDSVLHLEHQEAFERKQQKLIRIVLSVYPCSILNRLCSTTAILSCFSLFHKAVPPLHGFAREQPAPRQPENRITHPSNPCTKITAGNKILRPPTPASCPSVLRDGLKKSMCFSDRCISSGSQAEHIPHISSKLLKSPHLVKSPEWFAGGVGSNQPECRWASYPIPTSQILPWSSRHSLFNVCKALC